MAENILTKQVAGIPMGAWGVVVAGGLGIAYMLNKNQARSEGAVEPLVEPGVGTGLVPAGAAFVTDSGTTAPTGPENNQAWGVIAKNWLITQGQDPTTADNAVRKYISGENLTIQENALIALVLARFGSPPEDIPPVTVPTTPPPATEPTGAPTLTIDQAQTRTLRSPVSITIRGKALVGGKPSLVPGLISFTVYASNGTVWGVQAIPIDSQGNYTKVVKFSARGTRKYMLQWRGNTIVRYIKVT